MDKKQPDPFRTHLVECRRLIEAGDHAKAADDVMAVLAVQPNHPDANYLMGIAQAHLKNGDAAIKYLERAHQARPGIPLVMKELAQAYRRAGRDEAAEALQDQLSALKQSRS